MLVLAETILVKPSKTFGNQPEMSQKKYSM